MKKILFALFAVVIAVSANAQDKKKLFKDFLKYSTVYVSGDIKNSKENVHEILLCGGGRKNQLLLKKIKENLPSKVNVKNIDKYKINGDFVESQAFAFLAIRSFINLPISYPNTTGCKKPCVGGSIIKN